MPGVVRGAETPPWLLDALRGAAIGAATGTLGAPVDLAALPLRLFGYDNPEPVGGSEWWRKTLEGAGFYPPRSGSTAETVGEVVGSLAAPGPDVGPLLHGMGLGAPLLVGALKSADKTRVPRSSKAKGIGLGASADELLATQPVKGPPSYKGDPLPLRKLSQEEAIARALSGEFHVLKPEGAVSGKEFAGQGKRTELLSAYLQNPKLLQKWKEGAVLPAVALAVMQGLGSFAPAEDGGNGS